MDNRLKRENQRRCGFSLLEMIFASFLMVGVLVPSLAVVRDAMAKSRDLHQRNLLANYAVYLLEEQAAVVAANWTTGLIEGSLASFGHPSLRYSITRTDNSASGGLEDRLMHVQVTVFQDMNGNAQWDSNEPRVSFRTKIAKIASYVDASQ